MVGSKRSTRKDVSAERPLKAVEGALPVNVNHNLFNHPDLHLRGTFEAPDKVLRHELSRLAHDFLSFPLQQKNHLKQLKSEITRKNEAKTPAKLRTTLKGIENAILEFDAFTISESDEEKENDNVPVLPPENEVKPVEEVEMKNEEAAEEEANEPTVELEKNVAQVKKEVPDEDTGDSMGSSFLALTPEPPKKKTLTPALKVEPKSTPRVTPRSPRVPFRAAPLSGTHTPAVDARSGSMPTTAKSGSIVRHTSSKTPAKSVESSVPRLGTPVQRVIRDASRTPKKTQSPARAPTFKPAVQASAGHQSRTPVRVVRAAPMENAKARQLEDLKHRMEQLEKKRQKEEMAAERVKQMHAEKVERLKREREERALRAQTKREQQQAEDRARHEEQRRKEEELTKFRQQEQRYTHSPTRAFGARSPVRASPSPTRHAKKPTTKHAPTRVLNFTEEDEAPAKKPPRKLTRIDTLGEVNDALPLRRKQSIAQRIEAEEKAREEAEKQRRAQLEAEAKEKAAKAEEERRRKEQEARRREEEARRREEAARREAEEAKARLNVSAPSQLKNQHLANVSQDSVSSGSPTPKTPTSYDMTMEKVFLPSTDNDYNIIDLSSGDETDDDERPRKIVPRWAKPFELKKALEVQRKHKIDTESFFGVITVPDLKIIFGNKAKAQYDKRGRSAIWNSPIENPTQGQSRYFARLQQNGQAS